MTAILIRMSVCLAILVAVVVILAVIGSISPAGRNRMIRVLMFSSLREANRAAFIAAWELQESGQVSEPRYLADINRYFVVIEEVSRDERLVAIDWDAGSRAED